MVDIVGFRAAKTMAEGYCVLRNQSTILSACGPVACVLRPAYQLPPYSRCRVKWGPGRGREGKHNVAAEKLATGMGHDRHGCTVVAVVDSIFVRDLACLGLGVRLCSKTPHPSTAPAPTSPQSPQARTAPMLRTHTRRPLTTHAQHPHPQSVPLDSLAFGTN